MPLQYTVNRVVGDTHIYIDADGNDIVNANGSSNIIYLTFSELSTLLNTHTPLIGGDIEEQLMIHEVNEDHSYTGKSAIITGSDNYSSEGNNDSSEGNNPSLYDLSYIGDGSRFEVSGLSYTAAIQDVLTRFNPRNLTDPTVLNPLSSVSGGNAAQRGMGGVFGPGFTTSAKGPNTNGGRRRSRRVNKTKKVKKFRKSRNRRSRRYRK